MEEDKDEYEELVRNPDCPWWGGVEVGEVAKLLFGRSPQVSPWKWSGIMVGGRQMHTLKGHLGGVWSVAFSPNSTRIVSGSGDHLVKIWDTATGALVSSVVGVR